MTQSSSPVKSQPQRFVRLRKFAARVGALAARVTDPFPLTPLGAVVSVLGGLALYYLGIKRVDLVVLAMAGVTVMLSVLSVLFVSLTAVALKVKISRTLAKVTRDSLALECGFATRPGFDLPSLWWVPFVTVRWEWVTPEATVRVVKERRRLHEEVIPVRRGLFSEVVRRVEVSDPFGLARCAFRVRDPRAARALPSVGALKRVEVVRTLAPGEDMPNPKGGPDGERADMRAYSPGDPIKFILWKVFARTGDLVLRAPERAFSPAKQTTAYVVSGEGDEAAAGVARLLVETRSLGTQWVLGADGSDDEARGPQQAMELIARSGNTPRADGALGLAAFLKRHASAGGRVVVLCPATPGPWLERARAAAAQGRASGTLGAVEFIVCADGVAPTVKRSRLRRWLFDSKPAEREAEGGGDPLPTQAQLRDVCSALASGRGGVLIVDRRAGRVYGDAHRRALEAA
ncbi:MAG: DUF58 domain-containing protein [Deltaproteobacteria bacterium]|nr:DUF58 domain-containing protein [Deltaproteobacteria bacterium]